MNRVIRFCALGLLVCVLTATDTFASGLFLPARFARTQAMGGTGIARGLDLSAVADNPGAMSDISGTTVMLNYHLYYLDNSFKRIDPTGKEVFAETNNVAGFFNHIPNFFVGSDFGVPGLMVTGGVWSPIGPRHSYDEFGPQRYSMIFNQIQLLYFGAGASYKPIPQLSFGATIAFANVLAKQHIALMILPGSPSLDGKIKIDGSKFLMPMGVFGAKANILPKLSVGVAYQTSINVEMDGDLTAEVPILKSGTFGKDTIVAKQVLPDELRVGLAWTDDRWAIELASKLYFWSRYKQLEVELGTGKIGEFTLEDIVVKKKNTDGYSINLGGSFAITPMHELRLGGFFDAASIDQNYVTITEFDSDKFGATIGYGFNWKKLKLSFAGMKVFYSEVEATNSQVKAITAFGDPPVVGAGTYLWDVITLGGSIEYTF